MHLKAWTAATSDTSFQINPAEYRDWESIAWKIRRPSRKKLSTQNTSLKRGVGNDSETFLEGWESFFERQEIQRTILSARYFAE